MVKQDSQLVVLAVGHSTRPLEDCVGRLAAQSVSQLFYVRILTPFASVDGTLITYSPQVPSPRMAESDSFALVILLVAAAYGPDCRFQA